MAMMGRKFPSNLDSLEDMVLLFFGVLLFKTFNRLAFWDFFPPPYACHSPRKSQAKPSFATGSELLQLQLRKRKEDFMSMDAIRSRWRCFGGVSVVCLC